MTHPTEQETPMTRQAELLDDADRIVATDLYPARCRKVVADLAAALRAQTAPAVSIRFTWAADDQEFWLHMKLPDGKQAGINLGNPKTMIATAALRALVRDADTEAKGKA